MQQRLADIDEAITAIASHLARGDLSDGLIFDAVRIRLLEIGEAVKALPATVTDAEPDMPWTQIARMRDHLAHRYFDTTPRSSRSPSTTTCQSWPPQSPDSAARQRADIRKFDPSRNSLPEITAFVEPARTSSPD